MAKWILGAILGLLIVNEAVWLVQMHWAREVLDEDDPPLAEQARKITVPYVTPGTEREKQLQQHYLEQCRALSNLAIRNAGERHWLIREGTTHGIVAFGLLALAIAAWVGCVRTCRQASAPPQPVPRS